MSSHAICLTSMLLVAALAGCSNAPPTEEPDRSSSTSTTAAASNTTTTALPTTLGNASSAPALTLNNCTNVGGVFPVPMAAARAVLPDGFEPVVSPNDPQGGATLYVLVLRCDGATVGGTAVEALHLAYAELAVVPPAQFEVPGITDYTVPLAFGANDPNVGNALADYKLGISGEGSLGLIVADSPGPQTVRFNVKDVTLTLTTQASPAPATALSSGDFVLFGVQDRVVQTVILASSVGGQAVDAAAVLDSEGLPLLEQARPATRGFSVAGFSLNLAPQPTAA